MRWGEWEVSQVPTLNNNNIILVVMKIICAVRVFAKVMISLKVVRNGAGTSIDYDVYNSSRSVSLHESSLIVIA